MYWSKYNIVFESPYGRFIYNTFTNNLMEMNASLISCIDKIISGDFSYLSEDDVLALKKNMILVDDDTNIYRSIKLQRLMSRLDTGYLTLTIAPTTACNFKCIYCYESGIAPLSAKAKLNLLEDTISFVKLFKNTKFLRVTWYGGEPLLQFEYIEKLSHRLMNMFENYNAHMITNAYLLDKAKSQKLKELKISAIQVTIDGLEKVHNERRPHKQNNDSFQRIVHNLDDLFSVYPEISIEFRVNVDKSNQSEYHRIYNYLKERYGKYSINIHPGYVTDDFSAESNGCCFEADEVNKFVLEQYDTHNIPISLYPRPIFGECSARHITSFVIGPEGELYKCWNDIGIKGKTTGTVKNVSLSHELLLKYLLENDPLSDANCERCFCFPICEGGCPYKRIYQKDSQERFCKAKREGIVENLKRHIDYKIKNNR